MLKALCIFLLFVSTPMVVFSDESTAHKEEVTDLSDLSEYEQFQAREFSRLDWKQPGMHELPSSHSTITLPTGYLLLIGQDAKRAREISESIGNDDLEAVVYHESFEHTVLFENIDCGYVSIDDWAQIDPNSLLSSIRENTEETNRERRKKKIEELHVVGWVHEPTLDRNTNTVYWAIKGKGEGEETFVNSVALRLGRHGYERVVWITQMSLYMPSGGYLEVMLGAHAFDPGHRYQDYVRGDKVAEYGIAALVAASVGGKLLKVTGLLAIVKKFGAFAVALIAGLFYKVKNFFKRDKN